ncbi:FUSC family protein [Fluviispira multicolorata]|uniref:Integral membrane bound transporter domain-containing protein n=1 Tax=Fluviispira multicolorata TaxID=2654512 RepID=A0A833JEI1_9BACT|nr:FUSC family protein [Fluviispira multicolorata]KAB8033210.1 hypothetical protein GCL57_00500 [Fluviispira multicolorata]
MLSLNFFVEMSKRMLRHLHFKEFFKTMINFEITEVRQAWRAGVICVLAVIIDEFFLKTEFPGWILITALVCLQANFGATIIKAKQRLVGTVLGCALAYLIVYLFPNDFKIYIIIILLSIVFAIYNSVTTVQSYTYSIFFFTLALMMLYVTVHPDGISFAILRIEDVTLGALLGTLGSFFLWPNFAKKSFHSDLKNIIRDKDILFQYIIEWIEGKRTYDEVYNQKVLSATQNQGARNRIYEIYYEIGKRNFPSKEYEAFILCQERIHYSLLTVFNALRVGSLEKRMDSFLYVKEQMQKIQSYFNESVLRLPFTKENALELRINSLDYWNFQDVEVRITKDLYNSKGRKISFEEIKLRSLLERLFQEIKMMNIEINKLHEYYSK